ncbi:unnamed protein product [Boreogadus saida]
MIGPVSTRRRYDRTNQHQWKYDKTNQYEEEAAERPADAEASHSVLQQCHIRVIDTFGTEPAYNHEEYATLHGYRTNWGYWNLNARQYMTMFPHTPDNSFMGFVSEELNETEKWNIQQNKVNNMAVVYGKEASMWKDSCGNVDCSALLSGTLGVCLNGYQDAGRPFPGLSSASFPSSGLLCMTLMGTNGEAGVLGKEGFLQILHRYMEVHGTVYYETQRPPEVPAFVKNHGLLPQHELQQLLRKAKA